MSETTKGLEREKNAGRDLYFSDQYFSIRQMASFAHQLEHIWKMRPTSAVEVGLGNGFVSTYLRRAGLPVITADINPSLEPDICAPLNELSSHLKETTDLVICCEVLEHMPLSELDANLDYLKAVGKRLFLTLPNAHPTFGFGGIFKFPRLPAKAYDLNFALPLKHKLEGGPHFWEVGYSRSCTRRAIVDRLKTRYKTVRSGRFELNAYHIWFECE